MKRQLISKNTSLFVRGIAVLMVVLSHYFEAGYESYAIELTPFSHFMSLLGDPGVGIFFFLSGYAIQKSYGEGNPGGRYLLGRLKSVYIPYLLIASATALINHAVTTPEEAIRLLTGADYWFMVIIFILYIAFFLVGQLPEKYRVFIMTVFIIDMSLMLYLWGYKEFWYNADWCFALGLILAKYDKYIPFVSKGFMIDIREPVISFIGRLSLYIYIMHIFVYNKVINLMVNVNISWYFKLAIVLLISLAASFLIEKILNLLYSLLGKRKEVSKC